MGTRSKLLTALVQEVLGPRDGPYEIITASPLDEYLTGVLQPPGTRVVEPGSEVDNLSGGPGAEQEDFGPSSEGIAEDDSGEVVFIPSVFTPAMDPRARPSSIGLSFRVRTESDSPSLQACITWARYFPLEEGRAAGEQKESRARDQKESPKWQRDPRCCVLSPLHGGTIYLGRNGETSREEAEIRLVVRLVPDGQEPGVFHVMLHLVNNIQPGDTGRFRTEDCIFQPQIRVVCNPGTILIASGSPRGRRDSEEERLDFLYRDRPVLARGHLVSAIWRDIDPERPADQGYEKERPKSGPPFTWVDGALLDEPTRRRFSPPDVRTEFVPVYAVQSPDWDWDQRYGDSPELDAEKIARMAGDPDGLVRALRPLVDGYRRWIEEQEVRAAQFSSSDQRIAKDLLRNCREALDRMERGLDLLRTDSDIRLSFAFASQAMALQAKWAHRTLKWRPFQIAFILMNLQSVADRTSPERKICDLLWVPTGGGKTEAYLGLVAFTIALRRRRSLQRSSGDRTGAGVSVISRYTLRLLTIQQFRRALAVITACEFLRVYGLKDGQQVGWRPDGWPDRSDFLWGTVPFRIGLWVGGNLTPNRLNTLFVPSRRGGRRPLHGALDILKGERGEGEPAQILTCPACGAWLAIPEKGLPPGTHRLHLVVRKPEQKVLANLSSIIQATASAGFGVSLNGYSQTSRNDTHLMLTVEVRTGQFLKAGDLDRWWTDGPGKHLELVAFRPSRAGYFPVQGPRQGIIDFEIWCPAPDCPLAGEWWCEGVPAARRDRTPSVSSTRHPASGKVLSDPTSLSLRLVPDVWRVKNAHQMACRIPLPALTVDEQVYRHLPAVLIATVDKFARLPFEPEASAIFGNTCYYEPHQGYYRIPRTKSPTAVSPPDPPDLIIQDELHLIEGPLGSLTGLYEVAVDFLCNDRDGPVKYVASTATIREAESQIQSLFNRSLRIFPPPGLEAGNRFFLRASREPHPLEEKSPGQLYAGICAPGRGPLTPIYRIWSRLLQESFLYYQQQSPDSDYFWTLVGYFNALRELAGAVALYRQDIPQRIEQIAGNNRRIITDDRALELSSRIASTHLPALLESLGRQAPDAPDALFATSMFGTGVDIPRLSLMVVHGQPKTTSAYIQATGRVGRGHGALVVTFLRASRPRDLSHYEFFCGYHRQLHRHVEPVTLMPFSPGALDLALGPVMVALLRHWREASHPWYRDATARDMKDHRSDQDMNRILDLLEQRACAQPAGRITSPQVVWNLAASGLDRWQQIASREKELVYVEYAIERRPEKPVVLGDPAHVRAGLPVVFDNAPQSMRDVEDTLDLEI